MEEKTHRWFNCVAFKLECSAIRLNCSVEINLDPSARWTRRRVSREPSISNALPCNRWIPSNIQNRPLLAASINGLSLQTVSPLDNMCRSCNNSLLLMSCIVDQMGDRGLTWYNTMFMGCSIWVDSLSMIFDFPDPFAPIRQTSPIAIDRCTSINNWSCLGMETKWLPSSVLEMETKRLPSSVLEMDTKWLSSFVLETETKRLPSSIWNDHYFSNVNVNIKKNSQMLTSIYILVLLPSIR